MSIVVAYEDPLLNGFSAAVMAFFRMLPRNRPISRDCKQIQATVYNHFGTHLAHMCSARSCMSSIWPKEIDLTDLTLPHTWYPFARKKKRRVVMHVGPTNSGKTHSAMLRLQECPSGIYCGPLRLLAWEVAERMNKANVPCNLITGQERKEIEGANHTALTVEMADLSREYACAVIDEIQMIGCPTRGYAFTRALLGLAVDELHLCGDPAVVDLIKDVLRPIDNLIEVQKYDRLSPLLPSSNSLKSFSNVKSGDCIVAFSRRSIYKIKKIIETQGKHKCAVVYGSLPPETRTRQAEQFNKGKLGFDVLVASDAVGMGLNLNIGRIVFSTLEKFDGTKLRPLNVMEIKQIAGRAGRFGSCFPEGEVTCFNAYDLPLLHASIGAPSLPVQAAGLFPSFEVLALYSTLHPSLTFVATLEDFLAKARLSPNYFMSSCDVMMDVARMLEDLPLSMEDRYIFCICPVDHEDDVAYGALLEFASSYATEGKVMLEKYFTPTRIFVPKTQVALVELESVHKVLELYIWLSFRLEHAFIDRELAVSQKAICSTLIEEGLKAIGFLGMGHDRLMQLRQVKRTMLKKENQTSS